MKKPAEDKPYVERQAGSFAVDAKTGAVTQVERATAPAPTPQELAEQAEAPAEPPPDPKKGK